MNTLHGQDITITNSQAILTKQTNTCLSPCRREERDSSHVYSRVGEKITVNSKPVS